MIQLNKKARIMCAAAALTLALLPVSCGTDDNNNNNSSNNVNSNGTNSNGVYDGANDGNDNILDDAGDAIENGASRLESDMGNIDDGMTNNSTATTTNNSTANQTTTTTKR